MSQETLVVDCRRPSSQALRPPRQARIASIRCSLAAVMYQAAARDD